MSETELMPCPFCGGEARLQRWRRTYGYYVICKKCGCRTPLYQHQYDSREKRQEDAIKAWNTRKPMERIVGRLNNNFRKVQNDEDLEWNRAIYKTIEIVKEEGGLDD